jgi:hypothetical protein
MWYPPNWWLLCAHNQYQIIACRIAASSHPGSFVIAVRVGVGTTNAANTSGISSARRIEIVADIVIRKTNIGIYGDTGLRIVFAIPGSLLVAQNRLRHCWPRTPW